MESMHAALREDGIICMQGECMWLHLQLIAKLLRDARQLFPTVDYAYTCIPTYPCGQIGFVLMSRNPKGLCSRVQSIIYDL